MSALTGTNVAKGLVPFTSDDDYETHDEKYGLGGYRTVANEAARDAIPAKRRRHGMLVRVRDTNEVFRYDGEDLTKNDAVWVDHAAEQPVSTAQQAALDAKADASAVDDALAEKADSAAVNDALAEKAPLADPSFTGQANIAKTGAFDNENAAALRLRDATDADKMLTGGWDAAHDLAYLQSSKPGDENKVLAVQANGGGLLLGNLYEVVQAQCTFGTGSGVITITTGTPSIKTGAIAVHADIPAGAAVTVPTDWTPGRTPSMSVTIDQNPTAAHASATTVTFLWKHDAATLRDFYESRPGTNPDGRQDVQIQLVSTRDYTLIPRFLRAYGGNFSSPGTFANGDFEGKGVHADWFGGRVNDDGSMNRPFAPYGWNYSMTTIGDAGSASTRSGATLAVNPWNRYVEAGSDTPWVRFVDNIGGPATGDDGWVINATLDKTIKLLVGASPGQNALNRLSCFDPEEVPPGFAVYFVGIDKRAIHGSMGGGYFWSQTRGLAMSEHHRNLMRTVDAGLSTSETSWTGSGSPILGADFNEFTTVAAGAGCRLMPAKYKGLAVTVRNSAAETLLVHTFLMDLSCTIVTGQKVIQGFATTAGRNLFVGQTISGTGVHASAKIDHGTTNGFDIDFKSDGSPVITMTHDATGDGTVASFGGDDHINGASPNVAYRIPPGFEAHFLCTAPGQWKATLVRYQPYFASYWKNDTDQTGIANGTDTLVTFGTKVEGEDFGAYDTSTSTFTPPPGPFVISGQLFCQELTSGSLCYVVVYKNGAAWRSLSHTVADNSSPIRARVPFQAKGVGNGSDTYQVKVNITTASTGTVRGGIQTNLELASA